MFAEIEWGKLRMKDEEKLGEIAENLKRVNVTDKFEQNWMDAYVCTNTFLKVKQKALNEGMENYVRTYNCERLRRGETGCL